MDIRLKRELLLHSTFMYVQHDMHNSFVSELMVVDNRYQRPVVVEAHSFIFSRHHHIADLCTKIPTKSVKQVSK